MLIVALLCEPVRARAKTAASAMDESESDEEKGPEGTPALLEACCDSEVKKRSTLAHQS